MNQKRIKNLKKNSLKQEREAAKRLKLELTKASGSKDQKGDAYDEFFMAEFKATTKSSISLKGSWWDKLVRESKGKRFFIEIDMEGRLLYMLSSREFEEYRRLLRKEGVDYGR